MVPDELLFTSGNAGWGYHRVKNGRCTQMRDIYTAKSLSPAYLTAVRFRIRIRVESANDSGHP